MEFKSFPCKIFKIDNITDRLLLGTIFVDGHEIQHVDLNLLLDILLEAERIKGCSEDETFFSWLEDTDLNVSLDFRQREKSTSLRFLNGSRELWKFDLETEFLGSDVAELEKYISNRNSGDTILN